MNSTTRLERYFYMAEGRLLAAWRKVQTESASVAVQHVPFSADTRQAADAALVRA